MTDSVWKKIPSIISMIVPQHESKKKQVLDFGPQTLISKYCRNVVSNKTIIYSTIVLNFTTLLYIN